MLHDAAADGIAAAPAGTEALLSPVINPELVQQWDGSTRCYLPEMYTAETVVAAALASMAGRARLLTTCCLPLVICPTMVVLKSLERFPLKSKAERLQATARLRSPQNMADS